MDTNTTHTAPTRLIRLDRLDVFLVEEYERQGEKRSAWAKIGSAFPHRDGCGYRLVLRAIPVDGVLILRVPEKRD